MLCQQTEKFLHTHESHATSRVLCAHLTRFSIHDTSADYRRSADADVILTKTGTTATNSNKINTLEIDKKNVFSECVYCVVHITRAA